MGGSGMSLADRHCVPCRGGVPPLKGEALRQLSAQLSFWKVIEEHHLRGLPLASLGTARQHVDRALRSLHRCCHRPRPTTWASTSGRRSLSMFLNVPESRPSTFQAHTSNASSRQAWRASSYVPHFPDPIYPGEV
jgi:hypothetical protein